MRRLIALIGIGYVTMWSSSAAYGSEPNIVDFDSVYGRAFTYLMRGRYDEAVKTIGTVEGLVDANLDREPGRVINLLMIQARVYTFQRDLKGLDQFLIQFEKKYESTSVASRVRRAAQYERVLCYRLAEDLPQLAQALERYREILTENLTAPQGRTNGAESSLEQEFDIHVLTTIDIGDAYRLMGKRDLALREYRDAVQYLVVNNEKFNSMEARWLRTGPKDPVTPSKCRESILPALIRECEAPADSSLGILGGEVSCEAKRGDNLFSTAWEYPQRHLVESALAHYCKAQQALEVHKDKISGLDAVDKARYIQIQKDLPGKIDQCARQLAKMDSTSPSTRK